MLAQIKIWAVKNLFYLLVFAIGVISFSSFLVVKKFQRSSEEVRNAKDIIFSLDSVYESILSELPKSDK